MIPSTPFVPRIQIWKKKNWIFICICFSSPPAPPSLFLRPTLFACQLGEGRWVDQCANEQRLNQVSAHSLGGLLESRSTGRGLTGRFFFLLFFIRAIFSFHPSHPQKKNRSGFILTDGVVVFYFYRPSLLACVPHAAGGGGGKGLGWVSFPPFFFFFSIFFSSSSS